MRRTIKLLVLTGTLMALSVGTALAASPHFIGTPQATVSGNTLTVTFKAAGLGNAEGATFSLTGDVSVSSQCFTKSGNKPQADNKQENIAVNQTKTFPVRNGQTTGSFSITPLSSLTCPRGQNLVILSVDFSDLVLSGPGGLSYEF